MDLVALRTPAKLRARPLRSNKFCKIITSAKKRKYLNESSDKGGKYFTKNFHTERAEVLSGEGRVMDYGRREITSQLSIQHILASWSYALLMNPSVTINNTMSTLESPLSPPPTTPHHLS